MRITTAIALAALLLSCPKPPPDAPAKPWGPSEGRPLLKYTFYTTAASHGGESLAYRFSWGDTTTREWTRFYAPGEIVSASHRWLVPGTYGVAVRAQTADGSGSEWSSTTTVFINDGVNQRPRTPTQPIGPDTSWQREESPFYCLAPTDPDGDSVFLRFDWGDGDTGGWRGPLPAGDTAWDEHGWDGSGVQSVRCQAKDTRGAVSAWSAAHTFFSRPLIRPKWELFFGSHHGNTCPAIAGDGTIYVCGGDIIFAVNSDGTIRWQQALPAHGYPLGSVVLGPNGALHLAHGPAVAAFHPDGTSKWTYVGSADPVRTPAVGADGTVYFACRDSTVCALDSTGTLKWRTHVFSNRFADMALAIGTDASIYVGILDSLLAFDPSGNQRWALHLHFYEGTGFAVGSDGTIYGGAALTAIRPDGTILWSGDGWAVGAPVIGPDGTIYQETPHDLRAFKPDGTPLWTFRHFGAFMSTPAIAADGTIYVTSLEAPFLQAISPSGEELWRGLPWSEDFLDGPVAIGPDGTVYFAGEDGPLCAFAGTSPLANSPWPKYQHDLFNSGRAGGP